MALGGTSRAAGLWGVSWLASEKFLLNAMLQGRSFPCRLSFFLTGLKLDPDVVPLAIIQCFFLINIIIPTLKAKKTPICLCYLIFHLKCLLG
jgi:hypothetical protein